MRRLSDSDRSATYLPPAPVHGPAGSVFAAGTALAGLFSLAALEIRGRHETGRPAAPVNAVSHWIWGDEALHRDDRTASHTLVGAGIHMVSGALWAGVYEIVRRRHRTPDRVGAVTDAVAVAGLAAAVDLEMTPHRLRPGFEHRLSRAGLFWVYGSFAVGLAVAGLATLRQGSGGPIARRR